MSSRAFDRSGGLALLSPTTLAIPAMESARWLGVACVEEEDWHGKISRLEELGVASKNIVTLFLERTLRTLMSLQGFRARSLPHSTQTLYGV